MQFSIFDSVRSKAQLCTPELFYAKTHDEALLPLYDAIAAAQGEQRQLLKKRLPGVTWQAHFPDGRRVNDAGIDSGAFMADFDHIADPAAAWTLLAPRKEQLGILAAHMTPSREGLRLVLRRPRSLPTIAACQARLAEQIGTLEVNGERITDHLDAGVKDRARFSYLVPANYFYYMDESALFGDEEVFLNENENENGLREDGGGNINENENRASSESGDGLAQSLPSREGGKDAQRLNENCIPADTSTEASSPTAQEAPSFRRGLGEASLGMASYHGRSIRAIGEAYLRAFGDPEPGTRHTYYYRMCARFKYITDCNQAVLLAELPTLGLSEGERRCECQHACSRPTGGSIPKEFYAFLCREGLIESKEGNEQAAQQAKVQQEVQEAEEAADQQEQWEKELAESALMRIPVFAALARISPRDFVLPQVYAAEAALATLFTNLQARYLDGFHHTPTVHNVIYAPASCGKSFARRTVEMLTARLRQRDEETLALEQVYLEACRKAKNSKAQPEKPALPLRVISGIISQPKLLTRQQDAGGLHQLCFVEEIDTLNKGNKGGAYNDKGDMYRNAWDNASYSQDYMSDSTFSGRVNLYLNILATGTPEQVMRFYESPENGLISRLSLCPIQNQEYASIPLWGEYTEEEQAAIGRVLDYADSLTYYTLPDGTEHTLTRRDITDDLLFMYQPLADWLEEKRLLALRTSDQALDHFRKREAVKMFRMAMVCYGCFCGELNDERRADIVAFCRWWGEHDLTNLLALYGDMVSEFEGKGTPAKPDIFTSLPHSFSAADVEKARLAAGITSRTSSIIYRWRKAGLIQKVFNTYVKEESISQRD